MQTNGPSVLPTGSPFLIRLCKQMVGYVYGWFASNMGVSAVLLTLILFSSVAAGQWTTPVPLNPSSGQQGAPYIAISRTGLIAVASGEGPIAVYVSSDRGGTFSRTLVPLPAVPEYVMRGARGVDFDQQGNLFVLWRWDETNGPFTISESFVLSKSTDTDATYSTFWEKRQQQDLGQVPHLLHVDSQNTIHVICDSTTAYPEIFRLRYTRFINGSPNNRVDHVLPRPQDTLSEGTVSLLILGDTTHYAATANHYLGGGQSINLPFYTSSTDMGNTFSPMKQLDTAPSMGSLLSRVTSGNVIVYGASRDGSTLEVTARTFVDSTFSLPFRLGSKQFESPLLARITLVSFQSRNYLLYDGLDSVAVGCYYEYEDLTAAPIDSAFFHRLMWTRLVIDSLGGKYAVGFHQQEFRVYFARKDVVNSVNDQNHISNQNSLVLTAMGDHGRRGIVVDMYLDRPAEGTLKVFDILGREVRHVYTGHINQGNSEFDVSTDNLASGVYFVSLRSSIGAVVTKFLITQ